MTISTYSELQTAVAGWAQRSDLTALIPDFISLAEKRIKAMLSPAPYELEVTLNTAPSVDTIALPADFETPIALWIADINPRYELTQWLPQELPYTTTPCRPLEWSIDGVNIRFQAPADGAYPIKFRYVQSIALSDAGPTNYILESYPDVYLFGSLAEAFSYIRDDEQATKYDGRFRTAIDLAKGQEASKNKNVPLLTEFGMLQRTRFNINRGY